MDRVVAIVVAWLLAWALARAALRHLRSARRRHPQETGTSLSVVVPQAEASRLTDEQVLERVLSIVRREQVPVLPRAWQMWSKQRHQWGEDIAGCYDARTGIIWLRPEHQRNPWILLHELGHHELVKMGRLAHTEAEANDAGRRILLPLLTADEARGVQHLIDIWLPPLGWAWSREAGHLVQDAEAAA